MNQNRCLLITGTIVPNSNYVSHTNVDERLKEYYKALFYYSSEFSNDTIYFLENSSYDFSGDEKFTQLFSEKKITLLKFPVSDKYHEGKGFQEFEMLDNTVDLLKEKHHTFIKITGRYIVKNLNKITLNTTKELLIEQHKQLKVAHTNVFYCTFNFYSNYFKGLYKNVNDSKGIIIEQLIYNQLKLVEKKSNVGLFPESPIIQGISGSYGLTIARNPLKMKIRNMERKILAVFGINEFLIEY